MDGSRRKQHLIDRVTFYRNEKRVSDDSSTFENDARQL
jgi:hypothetical protein